MSATETEKVSLRKPVIWLLLPVILYLPYWWFFHDYFPRRGVRPGLDLEHIRFHCAVFWYLTYFPFAAVCFVSSVLMLGRRARQSSGARWALVPAILFTLMSIGVLIIFFLGL